MRKPDPGVFRYFCNIFVPRLMACVKIKSIEMKKGILFFLLLIASSWCQAQSFQLSSYAISITGDRDSLLHATAVLHNVSNNTIDVRVDKSINNITPPQYSYFCWAGQCYNQATTSSPFTTTMAPGDSSVPGPAGFIAYLNPSSAVGTADVTYCFYDDLNAGDSICITFNYNAIVTGIRELMASGVALTTPFPNPANAYAQIGLNLASVKNAKLVIYNMLGSVVREIKVTDKQKLVTFSTTDFKNGIYLYSLINDDKVIASKKLVINH